MIKKKPKLVDAVTTSDGLMDNVYGITWIKDHSYRNIYGEIPDEIKERTEKLNSNISTFIGSFSYQILTYTLPATIIMTFVGVLLSFIFKFYLGIPISAFFIISTNYLAFEIRINTLRNLVKSVLSEVYEDDLQVVKHNFRCFMDAKFTREDDGPRNFEMHIRFVEKEKDQLMKESGKDMKELYQKRTEKIQNNAADEKVKNYFLSNDGKSFKAFYPGVFVDVRNLEKEDERSKFI